MAFLYIECSGACLFISSLSGTYRWGVVSVPKGCKMVTVAFPPLFLVVHWLGVGLRGRGGRMYEYTFLRPGPTQIPPIFTQGSLYF